jgi:type IV secretion system protein VirD4
MASSGPHPAARIPSHRPLALALVACVVFAAWVATQYVAYRLEYGSVLGPWWRTLPPDSAPAWRAASAVLAIVAIATAILARRARAAAPAAAVCLFASAAACIVTVGPVYPPYAGVVWLARMGELPRVIAKVQEGVWVFGGALTATLTLVMAARPGARRVAPSTSHGSARWGSGAELLRPTGLLLGRPISDGATRPPKDGTRRLSFLRYAGEGHLLTVAPTRSGKGVGCVIPNLLTYPGSVLVTDPKGENYAVTARARRSLGQVVHALDPFDAVGGTAALNPLDLIDAGSADALDDARLIADMLVVADSKPGGEHAFWNEEARGLLTGFVLHVAASAPPELRTLAYVRELLTLPPLQFEALLDEMLECQAANGLVARASARVLQKAEKERSGVISTAQNHTHFLDSPRMARVMGASTFALEELKRDRASVYLVLPPERMDGYHRWLRLMIAAALLAMTRTGGQPPERVLFLLDEFAHLGRMQPVERDIGLVGGYGVTFWLLVQDLSQLKGTYAERWQTFLANCDVLQAFSPNDWDTADYLSKMTGETTILVESENASAGVSRGRHGQRQEGVARTVAEKGRRLLTPDEVLRLGAEESLLFVRGRAPVYARRVSYLRDPEFAGLADENPMHASVGARARDLPLGVDCDAIAPSPGRRA